MDINEISSLFTLYSGEKYDDKLPLIELAVRETQTKLLAGADKDDARLSGLCASIANLRYVQFDISRQRSLLTAAGGVSSSSGDGGRLDAAYAAVREMTSLCRDLIGDDEFVFMGTKG